MVIDLDTPKYQEYFKKIKKAYFEYEGSKSIIIFMITNNLSDSPQYQLYWNEYINYLTIYENTKKIFEEFMINTEKMEKNKKYFWEIDFQKRVVIIE